MTEFGHYDPAARAPRLARLAWHLLWMGVLFLGAWVRWTSPWWLLGSAGTALIWFLLSRRRTRPHALVAGLLLVGTLFGFWGQGQIRAPAPGMDGGLVDHDRNVEAALSRRFNEVIQAGDQAVQDALALLDREGAEDLQEPLSRIRQQRSVTALAIYDGSGHPMGWVGVHRGQVPGSIRQAAMPYAFSGGPLFRYLYFTGSSDDGAWRAMAAVLVQTNLPGGLRESGFAFRFREATGIPIRILPPDRVAGHPVVWDLDWDGTPLLSVVLEDRPPGEVLLARVRTWARVMAVLILVAWGILAWGSRDLEGFHKTASGSLILLVLVMPTGDLWPGHALTSPGYFLLPGPTGGTLGEVLAALGALGLLCGLLPLRRLGRTGPWMVGLAVAVAYPLLETFVHRGPSPAFLSGGLGEFLPYQLGLSLLLTLLACLALAVAGDDGEDAPVPWLLLGGGALSLGLAFVLGLLVRRGADVPSLYLGAWGLPAYLLARGTRGLGSGRKVLIWVMAAVLGSSAALPTAWRSQLQARIAETEIRLEDLGGEPDPYLEFRLLRLAEAADSLYDVIASPVELLYEIWASTAEREDPLPMWVTLWSQGNLFQENLSMGVFGGRPGEVDDFLDEAREAGRPVIRHLGLADARYVLLVPLEDGRVISACVPPGGSSSLSSALGPIFAAAGQVGAGPLSLVPVPPDDGVGVTDGEQEVSWAWGQNGWRGSIPLRFPDGWYVARSTVDLPGKLHMVARGMLVLLLDVFLFLLLWGLGRGLALGRELPAVETVRILGSFRARVTLALFGFFVLSIAIFGTLAFQTLSGAAERTATALAERLVEDGAAGYLEAGGQMELLAQEVGADLLEYRNGELEGGSAEELVELGLYEGWVPEPLFRELQDRSEVRGTHQASLARWEYVMAYRWLPDGDILATPVPVEAGATALRRREVGDLLGFAIVLGAGLSMALALLVGGTLTRPIETLQIASERVGSGNLRVRLPSDRRDEFGEVFGAFNRMVSRIRRARRALLRTTRRTQAIVEEAATGVVALDATGRVTLANPRAEALLKEQIVVGKPLPGRVGEAGALIHWVDLYFRDGIREATTEFQMGTRRIRVRARRVAGDRPLGGAVLSLEDVTDELRTERVLAWGEMAQQVAHEVKNPLTPIKLSVQHLQRAWEDRRPDFGDILEKNIGVILREIDHLAAIARSFSRFAAPQAAGEVPLEAVRIQDLAEEVMNLYRGGEGVLEFDSQVPARLPPVRAREAELREVLINLLENSRAAIQEEGRIVVEADYDEDRVQLKVRDNGKGIPRELQPRVFEPHFSTRSTGTGLGLAIVRRLVESWGGTVDVESQVGVGTVVSIHIPLWQDDQQELREG